MTDSMQNSGDSSDRNAFLAMIVEKLGMPNCDFHETYRKLTPARKTGHHHYAAGVLLPLLFQESTSGGKGEFVFLLIKRSSLVPQSGDLSLPGGMLHPVLDRLLRPLLVHPSFPILRGRARMHALQQQKSSFRLITLFLTNALRESWEEIRLSPARVRFLGPLPAYGLTLFQRTIFPLAAFVENIGTLCPNREVEKIVKIPLSSFYRNDVFGCYKIDASSRTGHGMIQYPCLIHSDADGKEEILWGATFHIIVGFLRIVADYRLPEWRQGPVIFKRLHPDYLTGRPQS